MNYVARSQVISTVAPALGEWLVAGGLIIDLPTAVTWEVFDTSTDERELAPVSSSGGPHVPLQTGDLSFVPVWTVPAQEPLGRHEIRWTFTLASGAVQSWRREFDVLDVGQRAPRSGYALLSEMRREGLAAAKYSDARVLTEIASASRYVDKVTRRWFEPRRLAANFDGTGSSGLLLDQPIIGLEAIQLLNDPTALDLSVVKVYNRHLVGGLDDRSSPRIAFYTNSEGTSGPLFPVGYPSPASWWGPRQWMRGAQNINVAGIFGYTDFDGSPTGETPLDIRKATRLLVVRGIQPMASAGRFDALNKNKLTGERTREQSYTLAQGRAGTGSFTGDIEIDDLLEAYLAPPQMGTV